MNGICGRISDEIIRMSNQIAANQINQVSQRLADLQIFDIQHQVFVNADMEICADYEQKSGC